MDLIKQAAGYSFVQRRIRPNMVVPKTRAKEYDRIAETFRP